MLHIFLPPLPVKSTRTCRWDKGQQAGWAGVGNKLRHSGVVRSAFASAHPVAVNFHHPPHHPLHACSTSTIKTSRHIDNGKRRRARTTPAFVGVTSSSTSSGTPGARTPLPAGPSSGSTAAANAAQLPTCHNVNRSMIAMAGAGD